MSTPGTMVRAAAVGANPAPVRPWWLADLWWLSTRRQWRQHGGALLMSAGMVLLLGAASASVPPGGEPYYLSLVLLLAASAIIASPILLSMESVMLSRRLEILPLSPQVRWLGRLLLSNSLRSTLALAVLAWGGFALASHGPGGSALVARSIQLLGIVLASLAGSLLVEDMIRYSRAVVFHQVLFLVMISGWPVMIEYLRTPSNFVPPPSWTGSPLATTFFFSAEAPASWLAVSTAAPFLLAGVFVYADFRLLARYQNRPSEPPSSVRWTAAVARLLSGRDAEGSALGKELLVPLRFLFLRATLIFLVLTSFAGFLIGAPYLLLAAPFWWQPLSTNALGPDHEDGQTRYHLLAVPLVTVLRWRLVAAVVLTLVAVAVPGLFALFTGLLEPPTPGPDHPAMYLVALGYSLSLLPLWAIGGDRFSLHYPDPLEMHTLLPERTRSGGAVAVLTLFFTWIGTIVTSLAFLGIAAGLVFVVSPGPLDTPRVAAVALLAGSANVAAYLVHTRRLAKRESGNHEG